MKKKPIIKGELQVSNIISLAYLVTLIVKDLKITGDGARYGGNNINSNQTLIIIYSVLLTATSE